MEDELKSQISPDQIKKIYDDNQVTPPELEQFRKDYSESLKQLQPNDPDNLEQNRESIQDASDTHFKKLRTLPRTVKSENFPNFSEWLQNVDVNAIEQQIRTNASEITSKIPEKTFSEEDIKQLLENKLQFFYHQAALLHKYNTNFGLNLDYNNPEENFNKFMSDYSSSLSSHFIEQIPETQSKGTITFVIGYSGAGKSSAIGQTEKIPNTPFEINEEGTLVLDSDNVQPFIPGYAGGAGSQNTSTYAIAVHRQLLQKAMNDNKDVIIPLVGGQLANMTSEIARALLNGYDNVVIKLVNTPPHVSFRNVINRSSQQGARIIPALVGASSNPIAVFETLSGKNGQTGEQIQNENLEDVKRKILDTIIKELGGKKKADPKILAERMQPFANIEDKVHFELIQSGTPTLAKHLLKLIKIATSMESRQKYAISDRIVKISLALITEK